MAKQISKTFLESLATHINELTGNPVEYMTEDANGNRECAVGHYHISSAYGGYSLHQARNTGGGVRDVFNIGHIPAKELSAYMNGYRTALYEQQAAREAAAS